MPQTDMSAEDEYLGKIYRLCYDGATTDLLKAIAQRDRDTLTKAAEKVLDKRHYTGGEWDEAIKTAVEAILAKETLPSAADRLCGACKRVCQYRIKRIGYEYTEEPCDQRRAILAPIAE